jgi:hypothetical protein
MLYLAAILSLAGAPGTAATHAPIEPLASPIPPPVVVAAQVVLDAATAVATVDLGGEIARALAAPRPAPSPLLRR